MKTPITSDEKSRDFYAEVSWCAEDIKFLRPDWGDEKCRQFLIENEESIRCGMIERGWYELEDTIKRKESERCRSSE